MSPARRGGTRRRSPPATGARHERTSRRGPQTSRAAPFAGSEPAESGQSPASRVNVAGGENDEREGNEDPELEERVSAQLGAGVDTGQFGVEGTGPAQRDRVGRQGRVVPARADRPDPQPATGDARRRE